MDAACFCEEPVNVSIKGTKKASQDHWEASFAQEWIGTEFSMKRVPTPHPTGFHTLHNPEPRRYLNLGMSLLICPTDLFEERSACIVMSLDGNVRGLHTFLLSQDFVEGE